MKTSDFDYELPPELIAQTPIDTRDQARLLVLDRKTGAIEHAYFFELGRFLRAGDVLVVNQTRVIAARLFARKVPTGGRVELLLLRRQEGRTWEALVGGKGLTTGKLLEIEGNLRARIVAVLDDSRRLVEFDSPVEEVFERVGLMPVPPYIHQRLEAPERYQTIFAKQLGSVAAPTAGLHFTPKLVAALKAQGILFAEVTLHIGLDTFAPVKEEIAEHHEIHTEWCQVTPQTADKINQARMAGGRVIAVGTTSVRTLESAARCFGEGGEPNDRVQACEGPTNLFILPGFQFKIVDTMITNFHLPRSTLIMLVSAFAGRERILSTYEIARQRGYRFYSFGDAMLII